MSCDAEQVELLQNCVLVECPVVKRPFPHSVSEKTLTHKMLAMKIAGSVFSLKECFLRTTLLAINWRANIRCRVKHQREGIQRMRRSDRNVIFDCVERSKNNVGAM